MTTETFAKLRAGDRVKAKHTGGINHFMKRLKEWLIRKLGGVTAAYHPEKLERDLDEAHSLAHYYSGIWDRMSQVCGHDEMRAMRIKLGYWTPEPLLNPTNLDLPPGARRPKPPRANRFSGLDTVRTSVDQKVSRA